MKLRYWTYNNPFVYPFTISKGTKTHQPCLVVELEHFGIKGYGEAPAITYYDVTVEQMVLDLERKKSFIEKYALTDPERFWHFLHHLLPGKNFLTCALDMAAWDLYGKLRGVPLFRLWGFDHSRAPMTDYTIGIDTIDKMLEKMKANPWPVYKIKLGTANDIDIVAAIRGNTTSKIRVDANAGWSFDEAVPLLEKLRILDVELIEQPLAKNADDDMLKLRKLSAVPLFADEACVTEKDVSRCADSFDGINIKLTKCGGITPARRMIKEARKLGMKIMIGSMNETTLGSAAIAHLIPAADFADLDGPLLLAQDIATGLHYEHGYATVSGEPGLGIHFNPTDQTS